MTHHDGKDSGGNLPSPGNLPASFCPFEAEPKQFEDLRPNSIRVTKQHTFGSPSAVCSRPPVPSSPPTGSSEHPAQWISEPLTFSFSFSGWCMSLCRRVLSCRTGFSRFVASTLFLRRDGPHAPSSALFPLPLPAFWPNAPADPGLSKLRRRARAVTKALHVLVCALNYTYSSRGPPPLDLLRRQPNDAQRRALSHLRRLLCACDSGTPIEVSSSGRRNLQLLARLQELAKAADALGFRESPYHQHAAGSHVKVDNTWDPKLSPFSEVDPARLKITGTGNWRAEQFLSPEFFMPFKEPKILECDEPVFERGQPNLAKDKPQRILDLLLKWDSLDLLHLHPASYIGASPDRKVRIFGAYKDQQYDRQIGDTRLQNAYEARIPGPSRDLPTGAMLTRLLVPRGYGVKVCITDRADFYHQICVSSERSQTNCVWPPFPMSAFEGTKAYAQLVEKASHAPRPV